MVSNADVETQKSFVYLQEVESLAQDILTARETKLELANAQNKYREALRGLESSEDRRSWLKVGNVYVERPTTECKVILREEIDRSEKDLDDFHEDIRNKTHKLRDLEHEPRLEGFTLKPMSLADAKALNKGFGLT